MFLSIIKISFPPTFFMMFGLAIYLRHKFTNG